ncbi:hypothetical protein M3Y97_00682700 [Aphelenchoides bicaudatus]|nr:hypothetical protein M3Y97_00682700 [Aphelenchoides bicaudatus]
MADKPVLIHPDYNTDVLWKPPRLSTRTRTVSTDSSDSSLASPDATSSGRRFSLSEYFAGSFMHRQGSVDSATGDIAPIKKHSITDNADFKDFLRRQKRILEE